MASREKDTKGLSGGEKSFSTLCLLMSLWDVSTLTHQVATKSDRSQRPLDVPYDASTSSMCSWMSKSLIVVRLRKAAFNPLCSPNSVNRVVAMKVRRSQFCCHAVDASNTCFSLQMMVRYLASCVSV